jgi:hypothetical protein
MPRYPPNKSPAEIKRRYFTLIPQGCAGAKAARRVGVSMSCGSLWFVDAGSVEFVETPVRPYGVTTHGTGVVAGRCLARAISWVTECGSVLGLSDRCIRRPQCLASVRVLV